MAARTSLESRSSFLVPVVVCLIVVSFVAATVFVHWRMTAIDRTALHIAENAAPSIEQLATARGDLRHLQLLMGDELRRYERGEPLDPARLEDTRQTWDRSIDAYLLLPVVPGERELRSEIVRSADVLETSLTHYEREVARGDRGAIDTSLRVVLPAAVARLYDAMTAATEMNAHQARELALQIRDLRTRWSYVALVLDIVCAAFALGGGILAHRVVRAHADLLERHRRLHEERAAELDAFAGRVAHDILSPLNTLALALQLAGAPIDSRRRDEILERGNVALGRVKALVSGLLEFARAGGKPVAGARSDLEKTLSELRKELEPAAALSGIQLVVGPAPACSVACNPGVLTSLIGNLTRNAIKHMGDGPVRRVEVRAFERGRFVHVEVEDTGPGIAPDVEARIFEPYFRGPSTTQPGVGLGLATVKRLAEAHGGRVGLRSVSGLGSTFWFELPKAEPTTSAEPSADVALAPSVART